MDNFDIDALQHPPSRMEKFAGTLRSIGHKLSMVPFIGAFVSPYFNAPAALIDTMDAYNNKGIGEAVKTAVSGAVDTAATSIAALTWWMLYPVNWATSLASGDSLPELARKGTKDVLDQLSPRTYDTYTEMTKFGRIPQETLLARQNQVLGANPKTVGAAPAIAAVPSLEPQPQQFVSAGHTAPDGKDIPPYYYTDGVAQQKGIDKEQARQRFSSSHAEDVAISRAVAAEQAQELNA